MYKTSCDNKGILRRDLLPTHLCLFSVFLGCWAGLDRKLVGVRRQVHTVPSSVLHMPERERAARGKGGKGGKGVTG